MVIISKISKGSRMDQVYLPKIRPPGFGVGNFVEIVPTQRKKINFYTHNLNYLEPIKTLIKDELFDYFEAVDNVILTGSFGGQLDIPAVMSLGMLPSLPQERVENIPNGAGFGAAEFLSDAGFVLGIQLAKAAQQIDLDQATEFQEVFVESLQFEGVA